LGWIPALRTAASQGVCRSTAPSPARRFRYIRNNRRGLAHACNPQPYRPRFTTERRRVLHLRPCVSEGENRYRIDSDLDQRRHRRLKRRGGEPPRQRSVIRLRRIDSRPGRGDIDASDGLHALFALNMHCALTGRTWALIANRAVRHLLRLADRDRLLPAVGSATEALQLVRRSSRGNRSLQLVRPTRLEAGGRWQPGLRGV
jgi:hypothetical protein